jgi:hypothetical protein
MKLSNDYVKSFSDIVLWGAGNCGINIMRLLSGKATCFWDKKHSEIRKVDGVPVYEPLSGNVKKDEALIVICVGDDSASDILNKLRKDGYRNVILYSDIEGLFFSDRVHDFHLKNIDAKSGGIVFAGDSIIEGMDLNRFCMGILSYNRGIGGDTVYGLLNRMEESFYELSPRKIFICIGTNDIARHVPPVKIAESIGRIVCEIGRYLPGTKTHVISLLPVNPNIANAIAAPRTNILIRETNGLIRDEVISRFGIYIDVYNRLSDEEGSLNISFTTDGLHLNEAGYTIFYACLSSFID